MRRQRCAACGMDGHNRRACSHPYSGSRDQEPVVVPPDGGDALVWLELHDRRMARARARRRNLALAAEVLRGILCD